MSKEKINFEETIKKLETIANELETGDLSLDDTITKFEEGIKLSNQCTKMLNEAEKKIFNIMQKKNQKGYSSIKDILVDTFAGLEKNLILKE